MESLERTKDIAAHWIARRRGENWNEEDAVELEAWLNASTGNRVAYLRLQALWRDADRLKLLGVGVKREGPPTPADYAGSPFFKHVTRSSARPPQRQAAPRAVGPRVSGFGRRLVRAAIAACIVAAAGLVYLGRTAFVEEAEIYTTHVGALSAVPLSDGSRITLNTDSEIHVLLTAHERRIQLDRGEAYFQVAKDSSRPFIVEAVDKRVVAVGTQFSVRRYPEGVRVAVTEGTVRVEPRPGQVGSGIAALPAGSVAQVERTRIAVEKHTVSEIEELLSWRSGYIIFHEASIAEAVAEFNRYNARKIVIVGPRVAELRISGNFRADNVESFARILEDGFSVEVSRTNGQIELSSRR
ncbi:MAG: FecR domain-containing protein [Gammaproteobacteria bacterium]